jgi:hypothetical protein
MHSNQSTHTSNFRPMNGDGNVIENMNSSFQQWQNWFQKIQLKIQSMQFDLNYGRKLHGLNVREEIDNYITQR